MIGVKLKKELLDLLIFDSHISQTLPEFITAECACTIQLERHMAGESPSQLVSSALKVALALMASVQLIA